MAASWIAWLGALSLVTMVASLVVLPLLVAQIPEDYFLHQRRAPAPWKDDRPLLRLLFLLLKNLLGVALLIGGLIMVFMPGQGLLTMAIGLMLLDYPGKYQLEQRIVRVPAILKGLNWLRAKRHAPPLRIDDPR
ncbi:MAG: PGPGW domain-containing protein [Porticoccaceae bacterium]|jgi:hypothetical protein